MRKFGSLSAIKNGLTATTPAGRATRPRTTTAKSAAWKAAYKTSISTTAFLRTHPIAAWRRTAEAGPTEVGTATRLSQPVPRGRTGSETAIAITTATGTEITAGIETTTGIATAPVRSIANGNTAGGNMSEKKPVTTTASIAAGTKTTATIPITETAMMTGTTTVAGITTTETITVTTATMIAPTRTITTRIARTEHQQDRLGLPDKVLGAVRRAASQTTARARPGRACGSIAHPTTHRVGSLA